MKRLAAENEALLLELAGVKKVFPARRGQFARKRAWVRAVDGVDLQIPPQATVGLVGESGCGKSTLGKMLLGLLPLDGGDIFFRERSMKQFQRTDWHTFRRAVQMIFQDPYSSLDPRMRIGSIIAEPLRHFRIVPRNKEKSRVGELLETVGLHASYARRYPHELSGGQRQRVSIARALACNPKLVVCDEPVSALDVSIQAQILNLLQDLQSQWGLSYLFIAHNLSVVRHISDTIAVMYLGQVVELAPKEELFANPLHPYTRTLLSAIPIPDPTAKNQEVILEGELPSPFAKFAGCKFQSRCPYALPACGETPPPFVNAASHHFVRCIRTEFMGTLKVSASPPAGAVKGGGFDVE